MHKIWNFHRNCVSWYQKLLHITIGSWHPLLHFSGCLGTRCNSIAVTPVTGCQSVFQPLIFLPDGRTSYLGQDLSSESFTVFRFFLLHSFPQCAKSKFSTKSKASNKTYPLLISMLQGSQKSIA